MRARYPCHKNGASSKIKMQLINFAYRGTSLLRNRLLVGPYSGPMRRALCWSFGGGGGAFL